MHNYYVLYFDIMLDLSGMAILLRSTDYQRRFIVSMIQYLNLLSLKYRLKVDQQLLRRLHRIMKPLMRLYTSMKKCIILLKQTSHLVPNVYRLLKMNQLKKHQAKNDFI